MACENQFFIFLKKIMILEEKDLFKKILIHNHQITGTYKKQGFKLTKSLQEYCSLKFIILLKKCWKKGIFSSLL